MMTKRIEEIDFLKCIFILLMIIFHLVYIGDKYPYAKQIVYTFHMPAFLLISGYLVRIDRCWANFLRAMGWIFIPYAIMETCYIAMSAILPVREQVDSFSISLWCEKLLLHPLGPYWYLHTLMLCGITYYIVDRCTARLKNELSVLIILILFYAVEAGILNILSLPNALYFACGAFLRRSRIRFTDFFRPSWWAIIPFVILICYPENLDKFTLSGVAITYLAISISLVIYQRLQNKIRHIFVYIGAHTFILLVFSPIFTMAVKPLVSVFAFDQSGMCFGIVSLVITVFGCFVIAGVMDRLRLSRFFWGKVRMLQPFFNNA